MGAGWMRARWVAPFCLLFVLTGCAVPQPRGNGRLTRVVEPESRRGYYLYLPEEYVRLEQAKDHAGLRARRWPLVVTFHGMKPFDNARPQALEWQQEADRYGFVVVAPELRAPDMFAQFPLRTVHPAFKGDEQATLRVLDHVFASTHADRGNVLATSWSSGGYMAHYMLNRHPDRFTCLAVRQSNFSESVMDAGAAPRSAYHPLFIINTQNDFAICKRESQRAVEWYSHNGYKNVAWIYVRHLGHERTPDLAADFFGRVSGVQPNRPPAVLAKRQTIDGNADGIALLSGKLKQFAAPPGATARAQPEVDLARRNDPITYAARPGATALPERANRGPAPNRDAAVGDGAVAIRVTPRTGIEPLYMHYSAECPADWQRSADFRWTLNGKAIGGGLNGQKTLTEPGDHTLGLLVVTARGEEHRAFQTIRVIPRLTSGGASGG
jgi:poly(3-hydroxybutyrate) depolymerase